MTERLPRKGVFKSKLHLIVVFAVLLVVAGRYLWYLDSNTGYAPDQPIPFSHKIHAGDYKMDCLYCHGSAEEGPHAGIPPMNVCIGCHSVVGLDKDHLKTLNKLYNDGQAVSWQRVHRLPDHVYFSRKWHLRAGVDCEQCHGDLAVMPLVGQVKRLEMGDYLGCHRQSQYHQAYLDSAKTDIDIFKRYPYMKYIDSWTLESRLANGETGTGIEKNPGRTATGVFAGHNAMTQCSTCHRGKLCVRGQASLFNLYGPGRLAGC